VLSHADSFISAPAHLFEAECVACRKRKRVGGNWRLVRRLSCGNAPSDPCLQIIELHTREHEDVPRLEVASRRRLQGSVENPLHYIRRHGALDKTTHRLAGAHRFIDVHFSRCHPPRTAPTSRHWM
jgi:hypothetical protein